MTHKPPAPPPRFSVVIPLYNKAETTERAVRSVLSQSLAELELIVVDDGSEDHGAESLLAIRDPRLTVMSQPNRGVSVARNVGVDAATASYVCFLDADDAWSPRFLEHIDRLITACPDAAMFCARYSFVTREGDISLGTIDLAHDHVGTVDDFFRTYRKSRSFINSSNVCIRKDVFDVVGKFPEGEPIGEDVYMWLRIAEVYEVAYDATILVTIFHDAPNRTDQRLRMRVPFHLKYYLGSDRHKPIREDLMRFLVSHCRIYAAAGLQQGDRQIGKNLASLLWPHSKFSALQCLAIASFPRSVAHLLRSMRQRRRVANAHSGTVRYPGDQ